MPEASTAKAVVATRTGLPPRSSNVPANIHVEYTSSMKGRAAIMLIRFSRPALSGVQYTEGTRTAYEAAPPTIPYAVSLNQNVSCRRSSSVPRRRIRTATATTRDGGEETGEA